MSVSWEAQCHVLYEDIKKQTLIIKEQQEEINRLTIAYKNASDHRQHYVEKCLRLSEVVLEFSSTFKGFTGMDGYERANLIFSKHKDIIGELERNLENKK